MSGISTNLVGKLERGQPILIALDCHTIGKERRLGSIFGDLNAKWEPSIGVRS